MRGKKKIVADERNTHDINLILFTLWRKIKNFYLIHHHTNKQFDYESENMREHWKYQRDFINDNFLWGERGKGGRFLNIPISYFKLKTKVLSSLIYLLLLLLRENLLFYMYVNIFWEIG